MGTPARDPGRLPLADGEADRLWAALADEDAKAAHDALGRLSRAPAEALRRAKESVRPVPAGDEGRLGDLIRALDSPHFADRERATLRFEKEAPHRLTGLGIRPGKAPAVKRAKPLTDEEIVQALDGLVRKLAAADRFSGAVLLAKGDAPLYRKAVGLASVSFQAPNRIDTKFNLGSMNKMLTAVAVAQLAQRGKLSFDDTLAKLVPDYPNKEVAGKVTIHQLLTHTSGMGSYFNDKYQQASKTRFRAVKMPPRSVRGPRPGFRHGRSRQERPHRREHERNDGAPKQRKITNLHGVDETGALQGQGNEIPQKLRQRPAHRRRQCRTRAPAARIPRMIST